MSSIDGYDNKREAPLLIRRVVLFVQSILATIVLIAAVYALDTRFDLVPPIGRFLSPFDGAWNRSVSTFEEIDHGAGKNAVQSLNVPGLEAPVEIQIDKDRITHIFAKNDRDLYFAQGYLIASERLFQMDFMSRTAAGRLSEVMGERTLAVDKHFIRLGLPQAAAATENVMMNDALTGTSIRAYVEGVNAYIAQLKPVDYPFEYRFLDFAPEEWSSLKVAHLLKFMAWNLAGHSHDIPLTRSLAKIGRRDFFDLFPLNLSVPEPVLPKSTKWSFETRSQVAPPVEHFEADVSMFDVGPTPHPSNGSNSWAVTGKKSTTGKPILSNDIHLGFALPSLWYEIQLVSPSHNVYGIALPGMPGVILGFNPKVAWGVTNGGTDVMDWYQLRFRDERRSEYLFDGQWRPVISRETQIKIRNRDPETITLRETHFGPLVYDGDEEPISPQFAKGLALRWAVLEATNELKSFLLLNRSKSVDDCRSALENYNTPAQNFLCADSKGDTGQWHMGRFPIRWRGQGRLVGDGSDKLYEWQGWIPRDEVPQVRNPERGFLSSANQAPTSNDYPHYLGSGFEVPFRAIRINELLSVKKKFSPEDFIAMQMDTVSVSAREILPFMLSAYADARATLREPSAQNPKAVSRHMSDAEMKLLKEWDFKFDTNSVAASIYYEWWSALENKLWSPHFPDRKAYAYPNILTTFDVLRGDNGMKWFDDKSTEDVVETRNDLFLRSYAEAIAELENETGTSNIEKWVWKRVRPTRFHHMGRLPGFGSKDIDAAGVAHAIFANTGTHGPVWKLVVAVGDKPRAWGLYPGGQSGDPFSKHYDDFIEPWTKGEMHEITFLMNENDANPRLSTVVRMSSGEEESQ